jgi:hypothetical protein
MRFITGLQNSVADNCGIGLAHAEDCSVESPIFFDETRITGIQHNLKQCLRHNIERSDAHWGNACFAPERRLDSSIALQML